MEELILALGITNAQLGSPTECICYLNTFLENLQNCLAVAVIIRR